MKTRDGRLSYEAAGDAALQPLVFLHGIGGAARAWRSQLEAFSNRYRAIAWDMPGYGGSSPPAKMIISSIADALQDFLREKSAAECKLGAQSIRRKAHQPILA